MIDETGNDDIQWSPVESTAETSIEQSGKLAQLGP